MPKINGNEIRPGNVLEHNNGLWAAVKVDHVKPGKGGAFAQVEMRNLRNGSKLNERFRSADKVERVRLEQKDQHRITAPCHAGLPKIYRTYFHIQPLVLGLHHAKN